MSEFIQESRYPTLHFDGDDYLFNKTYTDELGCRHLDYISVKDLQVKGDRNRNNAYNGDEL